MRKLQDKIVSLEELSRLRSILRNEKKSVAFTNGVFDIIHRGHVNYLQEARQRADILIVGLNSDRSVRKIKGPPRPFMPEKDRAEILAALEAVDFVCIFSEETPAVLIEKLRPDFLIKGGDYQLSEIVGREVVIAHGGQVLTIPLIPDRSTTTITQKIAELLKKDLSRI
ncbi:MAG: D-glycero-beta-D-manno-heptose 1-phosphate adenylyltransferase [Calditrichia bacterium]